MSLKVPLDQYTTHGQSVLETRYPTLQDSYKSTKLAALCLAHSRFVLLLQALVHSCSSAWEPEPCLRRAAVRSTRLLLAFPPSLSYLSQHPHVINHHHQHVMFPHVMFPPPQPSFTTSLGFDLAFSRSRAPVLRVFVPCTSVNSDSILACQQHLVHAGLWHHLSVGDVVCNLGYIPPVHHLSSTIWLLFNGLSLVPYSLHDILPIDNPITLPSPFYYSHLSSTLTLSIAEFPPLNPNALPQLAMLNVNAKVKSLIAPTGRVDVTKWVWTATLTIDNHPHPHFAPEIGQGWYGQWVLEAEGTSEAKQQLWDILTNRPVPARPTQWQLLRERSGNGTIWLRSDLGPCLADI